ncbi:MAG TPA: glycosyltransferase [Pyrinomonadaceae bacterium]|nr:glycosyltransferase [Pyrinomonadaceae bacterium]
MKFALISHALPPGGSGQAMTIYRLLRDLNPDDYCLISQQDYSSAESIIFDRLPGRYYHLPSEFSVNMRMPKWRRQMNTSLNLIFGAFRRGRRIAEILRRERCEAVVACTGGDLLNLPAGYRASRMLGLPFYPYYFDDYATQVPKLQFFAKRVEPRLLKRAEAVIAPNEFMSDVLRQRHGVSAVIVRNCCDISEYRSLPEKKTASGEVKIVYTGAIYGAHFDAFQRLLAAIELLNRPEIKLHVYTSEPLPKLQQEGIKGSVVFHGPRKATEMPAIQSEADLLFLPLAFESSYPELIRTSAPSKTGELLAAARPIIAHVPSDSFLAWYFRQHECGLVVDESDAVKLAQAIERILGDNDLQRKLSARARNRAEVDFDVSIARRKFAELLKLDVAGEPDARQMKVAQPLMNSF